MGGETVLLYLTGMGAVSPPVADGVGGGSATLSQTPALPTVLVGGFPGQVFYSGLAPGYTCLYQINVTCPRCRLAPHDQVVIPIP